MIEVGFLDRRIGPNIFLIGVAGKRLKIYFSYKLFPEEFARLHGHYCRDMGLVEDLSCEVELHADEIIDIRFNLDDAISIVPEISSVDSVLGGGEVAFLKRKCGCTVFITHREVARSNRFDGFKQGQAFNHRVKIRSGKPVAVDAVLMENTNETSQDKGVVNENSRSSRNSRALSA